jgi:hypothetical protein
MRDEERVRQSQSGILLGLGVGMLACALIWVSLAGLQWATGWTAPWPPVAIAGVIAGVLMFVSAWWGAR